MPSDLFDLESYDFPLPPELIAQHPAVSRDASRLLSYQTKNRTIADLPFRSVVDLFSPGDVLVVNNTKVFPARLLGRKETGGRVELLLLSFPAVDPLPVPGQPGWRQVEGVGLVKSSKRPRQGALLIFGEGLRAEVKEILADGKVVVLLYFSGTLPAQLEKCGQLPLPPYINRDPDGQSEEDRQRYQTVYAAHAGAVAAPTAGLHFTEALLEAIRAKGVVVAPVTLHVGYGTFAPVRVADIRHHLIHSEYLVVSEETATLVNRAKEAGGRVWAVGTTSIRALEFAADDQGRLHAREGACALYIYPGYCFKIVDNVITNFHLPQSSLLFLISALMGRDELLRCYRHAIAQRYRFFSYGDAMAIVTV
ncbi:MAG: tRNA preQ1(34) S-adenosylmethionine ribosyltransferase-isomerase QueA [Desulfurivibrionaceae bacterium]|nr:tRNA preQ1(34) S-adenosylmethionine ribosyltransferase-isomerase QueA [Desulfurivibrionaceae bacterium]